MTINNINKELVISGPWWTNDTPVSTTEESAPQETFFRIEFERADDLEFHLAAANYYQFWLNGEWMGYGPAQAPHNKLNIDTFALPMSKLKDNNTIAIQVFWEGLFTFDRILGTPGLYVSLSQLGQQWPCQTWVSSATGRQFLSRFSDQRGWTEVINGQLRPVGFPQGTWEPSEWAEPVLRKNDPEVQLEARGIKSFHFSEVLPHAVTWVGACDPSQRTTHRSMGYAHKSPDRNDPPESPSRRTQEETLVPSSAADKNISGILAHGTGPVILEADPNGNDRTLQVDFGKEVSGLFTFKVEAPAGTVIDIAWSESLYQSDMMTCWAESSQPDGSVAPRELCDCYQALSYTCRGDGEEVFQSLFLAALRHARIVFRVPSTKHNPIKLHALSIQTVGYPIEREGEFRCADENLNRIYQASVDTMINSISDVYMDCPGRERAGWLNDSYWAAVGFDSITADTAFDRRFIQQFVDSQAVMQEGGMVAPNYPSDTSKWGQRAITNHALFWALQAERYLRLHGDDNLKNDWLPGLSSLFSALAEYRNKEGLLEDLPWDHFIDWSRIEGGPVMGTSNALYALALQKLGSLFANEQWIEESKLVWSAVDKYFWNEGHQLYVDCLTRNAEGVLSTSNKFSIVTNNVILWTELPTKERADRTWRHLRNFHPQTLDRALLSYETDIVRGNLYSMFYRFDIEGRRQELDVLIRDLKETYLPMFDRGQTTLGEHLGNESSLCHGLNGYLSHIFVRHLAGIELPEKPGGLISIRPGSDLLPWCQARVPWMGGHVQVWWDKTRLLVSLPQGQSGEVILPNSPAQPFENGLSIHY
jgi:alpha-L-rhamnosidase